MKNHLTIEYDGYVMERSLGITCETVHSDPDEGKVKVTFRAVPSGGGLYPIETYLLPRNVEGLELDLYHYNPYEHILERLARTIDSEKADLLFLNSNTVTKASLGVILTAKFRRSAIKYGERAYRFILLEAGGILQNMCLCAEALGLRGVYVGGYVDPDVNSLIGCNGLEEAVISCGAIGMGGPSEFKSNCR